MHFGEGAEDPELPEYVGGRVPGTRVRRTRVRRLEQRERGLLGRPDFVPVDPITRGRPQRVHARPNARAPAAAYSASSSTAIPSWSENRRVLGKYGEFWT